MGEVRNAGGMEAVFREAEVATDAANLLALGSLIDSLAGGLPGGVPGREAAEAARATAALERLARASGLF
ncbi:hypothetical protein [Geobacter pickeringii]|uniref:Uncharacterized protein n=1 Tax=Geobacter pickeringii TaxID=345632 RepID=A0A0B5BJY2_9BACT|nr:hypothetical protein [Geobacter pickeringii]AJE04361.1 hypothetical protein GPICK_14265 [Geobacter pickeringii]